METRNKMGANEESRWLIKSTAEEVALAAQDIIVNAAQQAIHARGIFKIVLAGGTTPERVYELLANLPCHWEQWRIYLGDERCLPINDPERNSQMIQHTLLNKIDFPHGNIHFIPAELGAIEAAAEYQQIVHPALPFDLVLLGMGEDGHTASLFPNHQHNETESVHAVFNAPKPPAERVSMSSTSLSQNRTLLRLITGANKATAVQGWQNGEELPITKITTLGNEITLLDQAATGKA